ncbi:uncharacterized protein LOC132945712 [Metopolophium dirhodum]|uniref:uncharacterized protein LOC132945712 n=1 Tax=Metopolophium dirhodum TaxID=44670 RepID=UPI00298FD371|nr:uncharacterized protein LOC132945712 [Metopolophium dirhodum]
MTFISSIIVLNVSIILMIIIAFSNITFVYQIQSLELYQLANLDDPDYEKYLLQPKAQYEKKLNIHEYFRSIHNLHFIKFKLSGEKTWKARLRNTRSSCVSYRTAKYAVEEYYTKIFKNTIEKLTECCKVLVAISKCSENVCLIEYQHQNILDIVHSTSKNDPVVPSGFAGWKNLFQKNEVILNEKIGAIDKALNSEPRKKQFYQCFQDFKNAVFNMKIKNANYPKKATNIDTNGTKDLSIKEKKKILQLKDINFINKILNFNKKWLQGNYQLYTVYLPIY